MSRKTENSGGLMTQAALAELVGVSQVAVHRALSGLPGVSDSLRKKITAAAHHSGYRLHSGARSMRRGRFNAATLVLSAMSGSVSALPHDVLNAAARALDSHGMHMNLAVLPDAQLTDKNFMPRILNEWCSDGLLVNYNLAPPKQMADLIEQHGLPTVYLNERRSLNAVYPDDLGAGMLSTQALLARGHKRIAYYDFVNNAETVRSLHYSRADRREGYCRAMSDAGLAPYVVETPVGSFGPDQRIEQWTRILSRPDRPTAIVAQSINKLEPVLFAADRLRLRIPHDLSAITFAGSQPYMRYSFTYARVPEAGLGKAAVDMLVRHIADPTEPVASEVIPFTLEPGGTLDVAPEV